MAIKISGTTVIDDTRNITSANTITATGDITAFYSDERLKDFKGTITEATNKIEAINGYYYTANKIAQDLGYSDELQVGVSAQEVLEVLPEVVARAPISDVEGVVEANLAKQIEDQKAPATISGVPW